LCPADQHCTENLLSSPLNHGTTAASSAVKTMALFVVFNFISIVVNNKLKKNPFSRFQPIWLITSLGTSLISWVLLAVLIFLRMPNAVITGSVVASAIGR